MKTLGKKYRYYFYKKGGNCGNTTIAVDNVAEIIYWVNTFEKQGEKLTFVKYYDEIGGIDLIHRTYEYVATL
jgi:hypothetical protein